MNSTMEDLIIEILGDGKERKTAEIENALEKKEVKRAYDTLAHYLKSMNSSGILSRKSRGKPWNYYYSLNDIQRPFMDAEGAVA